MRCGSISVRKEEDPRSKSLPGASRCRRDCRLTARTRVPAGRHQQRHLRTVRAVVQIARIPEDVEALGAAALHAGVGVRNKHGTSGVGHGALCLNYLGVL